MTTQKEQLDLYKNKVSIMEKYYRYKNTLKNTERKLKVINIKLKLRPYDGLNRYNTKTVNPPCSEYMSSDEETASDDDE